MSLTEVVFYTVGIYVYYDSFIRGNDGKYMFLWFMIYCLVLVWLSGLIGL